MTMNESQKRAKEEAVLCCEKVMTSQDFYYLLLRYLNTGYVCGLIEATDKYHETTEELSKAIAKVRI